LAEYFKPNSGGQGDLFDRGLLPGTQQQGQVARVDVSNKGTGAFIEHVRVDAIGTQ
jgi:hypothetical protein